MEMKRKRNFRYRVACNPPSVAADVRKPAPSLSRGLKLLGRAGRSAPPYVGCYQTGAMVPMRVRNWRCLLPVNLEIHEARRAALPFNFSCISPALQAGGIFTCRFPRALPGRCPGLRHRAPSALVHGPNSREGVLDAVRLLFPLGGASRTKRFSGFAKSKNASAWTSQRSSTVKTNGA